MAEGARPISPVINVTIPIAGENRSQAESIGALPLLIRAVPGRPENQWQRPMTPDHAQIGGGKTLFTPVARRSDDRLVLANHLLKAFHRFECDRVLRFSKIDVGTGVNSILGKDDFHWVV